LTFAILASDLAVCFLPLPGVLALATMHLNFDRW
jgi:hypothetical protein